MTLDALQLSAADDASRTADITALYREYFQFVWRSLRRLGVREASVPDAVQDVFLVAHRKLNDFDNRGSASHKGWLYAIAVRVAAEHRRRDGRLQLDPDAELATVHPDQTLELRRRVNLLDRALDGLNDEQRAVFILAEIEQFSAPEIAASLSVKLNTVYSRLRLARMHFEQALARASSAGERGKS